MCPRSECNWGERLRSLHHLSKPVDPKSFKPLGCLPIVIHESKIKCILRIFQSPTLIKIEKDVRPCFCQASSLVSDFTVR